MISRQVVQIEIESIMKKWHDIEDGVARRTGIFLNDGDMELLIHPTLWKAIGDDYKSRSAPIPTHGIAFTC